MLTVVAPLKNTPAEKAGIKSGDKILKINDMVTTGMATDQAVKLIRGKQGTIVKLTIGRESAKAPIEITLTRSVIDIPTIDTEIKSGNDTASSTANATGLQKNGVFVIRLYSFSAPSPGLFRDALRKFVESGSTKLILDLRNNPGGYLEAAVDMASWFLPAGKIVVQEDFGVNNGGLNYYRSKGYNIFNDNLKFIILVNEGSASASEILSGALQEYGIAKLVGNTTFGKGSVQELINITPDTSLKVTVARWLTPNGKSISETGITPDYTVKITDKDLIAKKDSQMEKAVQLLQGQ
jgi:carboxyl-terminal processing protease